MLDVLFICAWFVVGALCIKDAIRNKKEKSYFWCVLHVVAAIACAVGIGRFIF